jgi:hypothetical protein
MSKFAYLLDLQHTLISLYFKNKPKKKALLGGEGLLNLLFDMDWKVDSWW